MLDPGWDSPESWLGLVHGLSILGFTPSRVMAIVATHRHSDHSGLVRRLHAESGAWIALHRADGPLPGPERGQAERRRENLARQMGVARRRRPGRPASEAGQPPPDLLLADGQLLPVAGRRLRVLWTPGHTAGHICVLDEDSMVLYAGDHLLPTITPNVSVNSRQRPDPIGDYLGSLARTADLGVHRVACAHQYHFAGAAARSRELIAHHRAALAALQAAAAARPGRTCWQLAVVVPWSQPFMQMPRRLQRAAATLFHGPPGAPGAHWRDPADRHRRRCRLGADLKPARLTGHEGPLMKRSTPADKWVGAFSRLGQCAGISVSGRSPITTARCATRSSSSP